MARSWATNEALGSKHRLAHNNTAYEDEANTFTVAPQTLTNAEASVNTLDVQSNTGDGGGMLRRFAIENNASQANVDIDFYNCVLVLGSTSAGSSGAVPLTAYSPAGSTYNPITIYLPGSASTIQFGINQAGSITQNVGGQASTAQTIAVAGEANPRHTVDEFGQHNWGAGAASAIDTNLYRAAANQLKTDDKLLTALGLGVGNSATATGPVGTVVKKIEVFDASGASLGYIPVYDAIT